MFRLGGSASGITSGLDSAKLNASRPGYNRGRVVNPGGYSGVEDEFKRYRGLYDKYAPTQPGGMPGSVSSFLTNFGLNLLSQSPTGNIFSTAGTAAKEPFARFQGARAAEMDQQRKLNQAILGDVLEAQTKKEVARIEGIGGDIGAVAKINNEINRLNKSIRDLTSEADELQRRKDNGEEIDEDRLEILTGPNGLIASASEQLRITTKTGTVMEQILTTLGPEWWMDRVSQYDTNPPETTKAAEEQARRDAEELLKGKQTKRTLYESDSDEKKQASLYSDDDFITTKRPAYSDYPALAAQGGRIGKQLGGEVSFEEDVEVEKPVGNQMQAASVQNLDYSTLRARLPQEIGDDIVQLLAQSEEALTEFANIRTQEDVDQFNSEFNVNLVLPQEV